ncbi:MAG: Plug domain-containing protein [Pseudomonadota bacterium]
MNILQGLAIGGLSLSMLSAGSAVAQTSDEEAANEELREDVIVVYGNKNASALDDVSASVGLVTSEDIQNRQLRNIRDSFRTLGNVFDTELADSGFIIRGINSEGLTPGGDPLAALYIDGAQQSSNGARRGASGLWDVQQIEVYRGPSAPRSQARSISKQSIQQMSGTREPA